MVSISSDDAPPLVGDQVPILRRGDCAGRNGQRRGRGKLEMTQTVQALRQAGLDVRGCALRVRPQGCFNCDYFGVGRVDVLRGDGDQAAVGRRAAMNHDRNLVCACGNPAKHKSQTGNICERCWNLEKPHRRTLRRSKIKPVIWTAWSLTP